MNNQKIVIKIKLTVQIVTKAHVLFKKGMTIFLKK